MHKHVNPMILAMKVVISFLLITGLTVTQAIPLSDAQLIATAKPLAKAQAIVAPAEPAPAQIAAVAPITKDPKNMAPLPCCQQMAILSIQAVVNVHSIANDKAVGGYIITSYHNSEKQIVRDLPNSRALVHTRLARQATLVGAYPSGTS